MRPSRDAPVLLQLRQYGYRGGKILPHRSIGGLRLSLASVAGGVVIAAGFTAFLLASKPWLTEVWGRQLVWWMHALDLPGQFELPASFATTELLELALPMIDVQIRNLAPISTVAHALGAAALWFAAGWLPDSARPATYFARFAALVHGGSVIYFMLWPASFPHSLISHTDGGLREAWTLMLLTPWLHLFTYYLFPFTFARRIALTAITLVFLFVLAPLQYATHAALVYALGMVIMPLLDLLFGVMIPVLGFIALYGWAMSWHDPTQHAQAD